MSSCPLTLLGVIPRVKNKILLYVSSGNGGIQDILNLRLVCSTTKLWVDRLPKQTGNVVFSKARIIVDFRFVSLCEFLESPPPFKVTTFVITVVEDLVKDFNESAWTHFCSYLSSNVQTLELQDHGHLGSNTSPRVFQLLESPNLLALYIDRGFILPDGTSPPSCFENVIILRAGSTLCGGQQKNQFYAKLNNNSNLRELCVPLIDIEDFEEVSNLIDLRKEDPQFQLFLDMSSLTWINIALNPRSQGYHLQRQVLQNLTNSIINSQSLIELRIISDLGKFVELMDELLPRDACLQLFTKVESVQNWKPTDDTLSLLEKFTRLRKLLHVDTSDSSVEFDRITFPPSLTELGFSGGFAPLIRLPPALTHIEFSENKLAEGSLRSLLNIIQSDCPSLTSLHFIGGLRFAAAEEDFPYGNFNRSPPFSKLKSLILGGTLVNDEQLEETWTALSNEFDWPNLELTDILLDFRDLNRRDLPVVDEEIIRGLCEGPSVKSLERICLSPAVVTPEALPLLKKLESMTRSKAYWVFHTDEI